MDLNISLAAEPVFHFGSVVITNSILTSWVVMFFIIFVFGIGAFKKSLVPSGVQNFVEVIIEGLFGFAVSIVGQKKAKEFFAIFGTIFIYVIFSNWFGLIPGVGPLGVWEELHGKTILIPLFRSPSADLNNTFAIAIVAVIAITYFGIKHLKFSFFKKFTAPGIGLLEFIGEYFSRPLSFAFRLFGNIFAGEVLLLVISSLLPLFGPIPFLALEIFVGFIQALVFSLLTLVFIGIGTSHH